MRRPAALLAAVVVLAACGDSPRTGSTTPAPAAPDAGCPERFPAPDADPWVPAAPTTETPGRLVPDADPVEALVCRYGDVFEAESAALEGAVVLQGGLGRIRTDLLVPARVEGAQRVCTAIGGRSVPHLLRLRYADGELWLSAVQEPNGCAPTGNGAFVSSAALGDRLAQAYDAGAWVEPDPDPCAPASTGRAGQERELVPDGWTSAVVCGQDGVPRALAADRAAQAAALLGQLATQPGTDACDGTPTSVRRLVLVFEQGPPVGVRWTPGCEPSVGNGSLSAVPTPAQSELLGVLLGGA